MKVKDLGEFGIIQRLTELITHQRKGEGYDAFEYQLLVDAGDDAAAWRSGSVTELATTDTVVEGVHFTRATIPWYDLGWKLMAANVSDIAAMGGLPLYALITLGLSPDTEVEDVDQLYAGMLDLAKEYSLSIVGGDVVRSSEVFVTASLTGATGYSPLLRSAAKVGDLVAVTGYLGSSAAGLKIMLENLGVDMETAEHLKKAHRRPRPCVPQGRILAQEGIKAAIDVSDGLVNDLSKLCQASGITARVLADQVPMDPLLKRAFPESYMDLALTGGEDYVLIFTAPQRLMEKVLPLLPPPATIIGDILEDSPGEVTVLDAAGKALPFLEGGWDHFR